MAMNQAMEMEEILAELECFEEGFFPRKAVREAVARKQEITPRLLSILERALESPEQIAYDEDYTGHLFAVFLLAQFRETRAYPLIVRLFSLAPPLVEAFFADVTTESLNRILASVCGDDLSLIKSLAENEDADEYVCHSALESLLCLYVAGQLPRDEVMAYYQSLFHGSVSREPSHFWNGLVSCCTDLYPEEMYEEIQQLFKEDLIDERFIDLEFINKKMAMGKGKVLAELKRKARFGLIVSAAHEMQDWACFQPVEKPLAVKIGRNDPCPCGSGKKFKKCCIEVIKGHIQQKKEREE